MDVQKTTINAIRILSAEAIEKAKSGHPGLCAFTRRFPLSGGFRSCPTYPAHYRPKPLRPLLPVPPSP